MKTLLTGVVCFLIGAASSPKAANENETLALLCHRFTTAATDWRGGFGVLKDAAVKTRGMAVGVDRALVAEAVSLSMQIARDAVCLQRAAEPRKAAQPAALAPGWGPNDKDDMFEPSFLRQ
jgi:hypothetical protein